MQHDPGDLFAYFVCSSMVNDPVNMFAQTLSAYGISSSAVIQPYGTGLINHTWKIAGQQQEYILQKINSNVFKTPQHIDSNIETIASYLQKHQPDYFFVAPLKTNNRESMLHVAGEGYFRLFPFVKDSCTYDVAASPKQALEAARQFGLFTRVLTHLPAEALKITLPGFHDLGWRYDQFEEAVANGNPDRIQEAATEITFLRLHHPLVTTFRQIESGVAFRLRVTHHDTKISNVLFDREGRGICVIDLDTVMPGYFISDVGDMMRTYLSPVSEEEQDLDKIIIREDYFRAIVQGYLSEMNTELTGTELQHFVYAGLFMVYMQALRFLADYLNDDRYYGAVYEKHNYNRARNQVTLLKRLLEKEKALTAIVFQFARQVPEKNNAAFQG